MDPRKLSNRIHTGTGRDISKQSALCISTLSIESKQWKL